MKTVSIIEGIEASRQQLEEIQGTAQQEVLVLDTALYPESEASNDAQIQLLSKGVSRRAIYDFTALEVEGRMRMIGERIEAGEQARAAAQRLPIKLSIVDRRIAAMLIHTSHEAHAAPALVIHEPFIVEALAARFESIWERSRPLSPHMSFDDAVGGTGSEGLAVRDIHILHLLAAGEPDLAIARQLGTSPVTIRQRIRRLIKALGVETRFQAGMAATERGWL